MSKEVLTVTTLVHYLKSSLENDPLTQHILVEGELSNFSSYRSGHWYFSLKDENALIRCVMFHSYNQKVDFEPKDGDQVIVTGNVSMYEARGDVQLLVTNMKANTIGALYQEFEKLKQKLFSEGLFDEAHKKPLPSYPMRIALVTGANTAARSDVLTTLDRRWPIASIDEYPVLVQGNESANQIIQALKACDNGDYDVILLCRGGGSIEDLWSFNDENLARVIYDLETPIVTGIGHEINFTIADYVADYRAPTPTGAAEIISPKIEDVYDFMYQLKRRLMNYMDGTLENLREDVEYYKKHRLFLNPERLYIEKELKLNELSAFFQQMLVQKENQLKRHLFEQENKLQTSLRNRIVSERVELNQTKLRLNHSLNSYDSKKKNEISRIISLLDAYSPLKVLQRGYGIVTKDSENIHSIKQVTKNDQIQVRLSDGQFLANINEIKED